MKKYCKNAVLTFEKSNKRVQLGILSYFYVPFLKQLVKYLLLCLPLLGFSQKKLTGSSDYYIKVAPTYGFILEHRSTIGHLVKGYIPGLEVDFVKPTRGNKKWHHENNFPDIGIAFNFIDFANPKQLGYCYAVSPFIEWPLNKKVRASRLVMRLNWGVSYLTKRFDIERDHKNIAIGSHWNTYFQMKWFWHLNINERLRVEPGLSFAHASNGRSQVPNLGLNVISFNLGVNYKIRNNTPSVPLEDSASVWPSKHELLVWNACGFNEHEPPTGPKYFANSFGVNYYYNVRNTHKWGFGSDVFYESQNKYHMEQSGITVNGWTDMLQLGVKACYAYNVGRISFPIEMGYYALSKSKEDGPIYHRIGIRHYCKNGLMLNFTMKSHWAVAAHFDYGIGYRFSIKKKKVNEI